MPRFVLLRHEMPADSGRATHWDLMLESDGALRTWALDEPLAVGAIVSATLLADHRIAYLDYEGPVSGNRGSVTRVDAGSYEPLVDEPNRVVIRIEGSKLIGRAELILIGDRWEARL